MEESGVVKFESDFTTITIGTQFAERMTENSPPWLLLEVSRIDTLFSVSDNRQFPDMRDTSQNVNILSKIVSLVSNNVRNTFLPKRLNVTMKHQTPHTEGSKVICHLSLRPDPIYWPAQPGDPRD